MTGVNETTHPEAGQVADAAAARAWVRTALAALDAARARIDQANVFPIADADTGTNMYLTVAEGARAVEALPLDASAPTVLRALSRGALLGARGNSGVILSEYLRGFSAALGDGPLAAKNVAEALSAAAASSRASVGQPVQGTILSAADAAGEAALAALVARGPGDEPSIVGVCWAARDAARDAMRRSPQELAVLSRAGVLDAGACGLVLVLDALWRAVGGDTRNTEPGADLAGSVAELLAGLVGPGVSVATDTMSAMDLTGTVLDDAPRLLREAAGDGEFEVMFVAEALTPGGATAYLADDLRAALQQIGDSVVVVGGESGTWQAHVHTDSPAAAILAGLEIAGTRARVRQVCTRHLDPAPAGGWPGGSADGSGIDTADRWGVVAVTSAIGLVPDMARSGAVVLVLTDEGAPRPEEIQRAAVDTAAVRVVVLPGSVAAGAAARAAAALSDQPGDLQLIEVLDAPTDLHVVAALASAQTGGWGAVDQAATMRAALADVRAVRVDAQDDGVGVRAVVCAALEELLLPDAEVLTVLPGRLVDQAVVELVVTVARERLPGVEVVVLDSGRDQALIDLGVE